MPHPATSGLVRVRPCTERNPRDLAPVQNRRLVLENAFRLYGGSPSVTGVPDVAAQGRRDHERGHGPHGLPPAPGPLHSGHPGAGRRRPARRRDRLSRTHPGRTVRIQARRRSPPGTASTTTRPIWTRRSLATMPRSTSTRSSRRPGSRPSCGRSRRASTSTRRSRRPRTWPTRSRWRGPPRRPESADGVVMDKLFLPGLLKLKRLIDGGFFGRILSVRGEFGYWVFEGDWQTSAAALVELPSRGRWRDHARHVPALELRPRVPVRPGSQRLRPDRDPHPRSGRRGRQRLRRHRRRRVVRAVRTRRRGRGADQLVVGGPRVPRRARRVPGGRHPRQRGRRAAPMPRSAPGRPHRSRSGTRT